MSKRIAMHLAALLLVAGALSLTLRNMDVMAQGLVEGKVESPKPQMKFSPIDAEGLNGAKLRRSKVPGGWLVAVRTSLENDSGFGIAFVPDPEHSWDGSSLK